MSSDAAPPVRPRPERLEGFVGRWSTRGRVLAGGSDPELEIVGTDTYEWLPGGYFLLHRVEVTIGGERVQAVEVMGRDPSGEGYFMHSYDSGGSAGVMRAEERDGAWTFLGDTERFTGAFGDGGGTLSGRWERREGERWLPWMDVRLTRAG